MSLGNNSTYCLNILEYIIKLCILKSCDIHPHIDLINTHIDICLGFEDLYLCPLSTCSEGRSYSSADSCYRTLKLLQEIVVI